MFCSHDSAPLRPRMLLYSRTASPSGTNTELHLSKLFLIRFDTTAIWDFSMQDVQFRVLKKSPNKTIYLIRDIKHTVKCPVVQSQFNQF